MVCLHNVSFETKEIRTLLKITKLHKYFSLTGHKLKLYEAVEGQLEVVEGRLEVVQDDLTLMKSCFLITFLIIGLKGHELFLL